MWAGRSCKSLWIASALAAWLCASPGAWASPGGVGFSHEPADAVSHANAGGPPDADGDGVPDEGDNCPAVPNSNQCDENANGIGEACEPPGWAIHLNDVWEFDLQTNTWTELHPAGDHFPASRFSAYDYDPIRQQLIVVGGEGDCLALNNDTYVLDLSSRGSESWTRLTTTGNPGPPEAFNPGYFDAARQRFQKITVPTVILSLDRSSNQWSSISATGDAPIANVQYFRTEMLVVDTTHDRAIFTYGPVTHALDLATYVWSVFPSTIPRPSGRSGATVEYDADNQRLIMFGGQGGGTTTFDETWVFDLAPGANTWTLKSPQNSPAARAQHSSTFDTLRGRMLVFGGLLYSPAFASLNDLWAFDGTDWTELSVPCDQRPPSRRGGMLVYDPVHDRLIVSGGEALPGDDADQDCVFVWDDNCPFDTNPDQQDADTDAFGDVCDNCPDLANAGQTDFDGDRSGDACDDDSDNDGVANADDVCPFTPLGMLVNPAGQPLGDWNDNCTVDLEDYSIFEICLWLSGPEDPPPFQECRDLFDFDADTDIDLADFAHFQSAAAPANL